MSTISEIRTIASVTDDGREAAMRRASRPASRAFIQIMNCYNHDARAAVGICKHCSKALCHDCCTDTGGGLACSASCVDEVRAVTNLVNRTTRTHASQKRNAYLFPAFFGFMGLLFFLFGLNRDGLTTRRCSGLACCQQLSDIPYQRSGYEVECEVIDISIERSYDRRQSEGKVGHVF
jgi:hypothetical protein